VTEPRRIYVTGPSGSGKSTLARRLGKALDLPVYDLDLVYRQGGGNAPLRPIQQRAADLQGILETDRWVAEGVHLGWTADLLAGADVIVWLDHLSPTATRGRVLRRFVRGAVESARGEHGTRRFLRFGDYARHLRELVRALRQAPDYADARGAEDAPTRPEIEAALQRFGDRVVRCRSQADVDRIFSRLAGKSATTER
jgi:energy-coupling factor transporter ATP-binding protein EcfA2